MVKNMKKVKMIMLYCVITLLIIGNVFQFAWNYSRFPVMMVLDRETAVAIAKVVAVEEFAPFYSPSQGYVDKNIYVGFDKPLMAWVVIAARPVEIGGIVVSGMGIEVVIRMRDGRILHIGDERPMRPVMPVPFSQQ